MLKPTHAVVSNILLFLVTLTLVVPESYAKRLGGGRSAGRQSQMSRQRAMPPSMPRQQAVPPTAAPAPASPSQPNLARQSLPPAAPMQIPPRQSGSPWGGMLGGALLGLGLGSIMSHGDRNTNAANQNAGVNADGTTARAGDEIQASPAQQAEQVPQSRFGSILVWGALALGAWFLIRRLRGRHRR